MDRRKTYLKRTQYDDNVDFFIIGRYIKHSINQELWAGLNRNPCAFWYRDNSQKETTRKISGQRQLASFKINL